MDHPRFGYLRVLVMLQARRLGNRQKRALRLYRLEGLQLRMKVKRRKRISLQRGRLTPATGPNQNWSQGLRARSDVGWTGIRGAHGDSRSGVARRCL